MDMLVQPLRAREAAIGERRRLSMESKRFGIYSLLAIFDVAALIIGFTLAGTVRSPRWLAVQDVPLLVAAVPLHLSFAVIYDAYSVQSLDSFSEAVRRGLTALAATAVAIIIFAFFAQIGAALSRLAFAYAIVASAVFVILGRVVVQAPKRWVFGESTVKRLLIVDNADHPPSKDFDVFLAASENLHPDLDDPAQVARVSQIVESYDLVLLATSEEHRLGWVTALKASGVSFQMLVSPQALHGAVGIGRIAGWDTLVLSRGPLSMASRVRKRVFDLVLAIPLVVVLAPLFLVTTVAIRIESPGPAIFRQPRIGRGNRTFSIYKFRSMRSERADSAGTKSTLRDDDRITRVGRFIRTTSIDELPQLFNVIAGSMSLVGPRPHAYASTAGDQLFWQVSRRYWMRHAFKPGITGLAQVRGFRGATERPEDLEGRLLSDLEYMENWSLWRDLVIMLATARVITHDNAF